MAGRVVAIAFAIALILGASTLQQIIDLQPDAAADLSNTAPSVDDVDRPVITIDLAIPDRQIVAMRWTTAQPEGRAHPLTVFRPPCPATSR